MPPRTSARRAASQASAGADAAASKSTASKPASTRRASSTATKRKAGDDEEEDVIEEKPKAAKGKAKSKVAKDEEDKKAHIASKPKAKGKAKAKVEADDEDSPLSELSDHEAGSGPKPPKKQKKSRARKDTAGGPDDSPFKPVSEDATADPSLPSNIGLPAEIQLEARPEGQIRIAAWNITSLKSAADKGMMRYIQAEDADILVLTETKVNETPIHPGLSAIYKHQYWGIGTKKGYAGTAILSKVKPIKITVGFPPETGKAADGEDAGQEEPELDTKGRIITAEFESLYLIGTYAVNAGEGLKSMPAKQHWQRLMAAHVASLDAKKPVVWCGDFNVAPSERDLAMANKKWNKSPGFTHIECDNHAKLLAGTATSDSKPFLDIWRELHPDAIGHYSFFGWRGQCRNKGIGWRLDSFIVSERFRERVKACEIRYEMYGPSDHIPVYCDIEGPL
ncbi:hypothetical protein OC842_005152 [Tilletia horrida]|uniref:DNA-(apurinic or apyrimidinic site) endonuclease n=1 Tax=Tilletia horrida TaxID=155126 RepID=A0AAN6G9M5_9BASI|nr:hypothetical protein OC842_005152 [Tilletia horrida]